MLEDFRTQYEIVGIRGSYKTFIYIAFGIVFNSKNLTEGIWWANIKRMKTAQISADEFLDNSDSSALIGIQIVSIAVLSERNGFSVFVC